MWGLLGEFALRLKSAFGAHTVRKVLADFAVCD